MNKKTNKNDDAAMAMISLRLPKETIVELKRAAPLLGFSGYQPLIRFYVTQSLQSDAAKLEAGAINDESVYRSNRSNVAGEKPLTTIAETRADYGVGAAPSFVVGMPEFVETSQQKGWGVETAELLNLLEDFDSGDAGTDPVAWVAEQRRQQTINRSKLP